MSTEGEARDLARDLLADALPTRWVHVQAVHAQAITIGDALPDVAADVLRQAALLHDIGYSPAVADAGFHPLDGARYLALHGWDSRIVALVARHSCAVVEARLRGVDGVEQFPDEATATRDALWFCDATTGPHGERFRPDERWAEIRQRYGSGHVVTRFLDEAEGSLRAAVTRIESAMRAQSVAPVQSM